MVITASAIVMRATVMIIAHAITMITEMRIGMTITAVMDTMTMTGADVRGSSSRN